VKLLMTEVTWLLRLARGLLTSAESLCLASLRSATQYRQIRYLIQPEAQPYRILLLIPKPMSASRPPCELGVRENVAQGPVTKAVKDRFASILTMDPNDNAIML
jgi:hypothetical protein